MPYYVEGDETRSKPPHVLGMRTSDTYHLYSASYRNTGLEKDWKPNIHTTNVTHGSGGWVKLTHQSQPTASYLPPSVISKKR